MSERIKAISDALAIVNRARIASYGETPAGWDFLWRVTQYLSAEQRREFDVLRTAEEAEAELETPVGC